MTIAGNLSDLYFIPRLHIICTFKVSIKNTSKGQTQTKAKQNKREKTESNVIDIDVVTGKMWRGKEVSCVFV